jgi:hypothetical protein
MFVFYKATLKISGIQRYKFDSMNNTAYFIMHCCAKKIGTSVSVKVYC